MKHDPALCRRKAWLGTALAVLLCASPLRGTGAQIGAAAGPGSDGEPLQIRADSGIEWQQDAKIYIARGNAVAARGASEVRADTLVAHYREAKAGSGNTEIYRVEATGRVTLKRDTGTVVGDSAVYDVDQGVAVITGKSLKLTTATDVVTARDSLEWYDQRQIAVARGDALASRAGKTIKADILTAYLQKTPASQAKPAGPRPRGAASEAKPSVVPAAAKDGAPGGESKISRVDAQGHVVITNGVDTGRGEYGVYNGETGIATLIGDVVIQRGKNVLRGQRGVMDLNNNVSRLLPGGPGAGRQRVQGLFIRDQQTKQGAAAPDAAPGSRERRP